MSQISISSDEFPNILMSFLLDCMNNGSPLVNEDFDVVLRKMKNAGVRSNLLQAYISMEGKYRVLYKFVRPVLMNERKGTTRITVAYGEEVKNEV